MSLLDHEFKKQGNRSISEGEGGVNVATLVEDQVSSSNFADHGKILILCTLVRRESYLWNQM